MPSASEIAIVRSEFFTSFNDLNFLIMLLNCVWIFWYSIGRTITLWIWYVQIMLSTVVKRRSVARSRTRRRSMAMHDNAPRLIFCDRPRVFA